MSKNSIRPKVLILTTSVFTDRIIQNGDFIDYIREHYDVDVWANSFKKNPSDWDALRLKVIGFPDTKQLRHWSSYLRKINEAAWVKAIPATSIEINQKYFSEKKFLNIVIKKIGHLIAFINGHQFFEGLVRSLLLHLAPNNHIQKHLIDGSFDCVLVTNPFWVQEPLVALEAIKLNIPVISLIPSWDNITTKSRIIYRSTAFMVWSDVRKPELTSYYQESKKIPIEIYGTPQYDVFKHENYIVSRAKFFEKYDLKNHLPILLYTLGSPFFIKSEIDVCLEFCKKMKELNFLNNFQILIRPHPIKDFSQYVPIFKDIHSNIHVQEDVQTPKSQKIRFQDVDMIKNWVSTFYYADLVIATSSTTLLDASMMNKPHINITANLTNNVTLDQFIRDVSFGFVHLQSLNKSRLLNNVDSWEEFIHQIEIFQKNPQSIKNTSKDIVLQLAGSENSGTYGKVFIQALNAVIQKIKQQ